MQLFVDYFIRLYIDNKHRNTITNIRDVIEAITGVRPDILKRKIDYTGWAQDNEVAQFPFGFFWNQNQDETPDGFLWYQGGKIQYLSI